MARKTAYQKQADKRTKDALKLRARHDARARKYALLLRQAILDAEAAAGRIYRINSLYGVDLAPRTLLTHQMAGMELSDKLRDATQGSAPGEEIQLFNPTPDGNGGVALGAEALFGEVVGAAPENLAPENPAPTNPAPTEPTPPATPPAAPPTPPPASPIQIQELTATLEDGSWQGSVTATSPSGSYRLRHSVYPADLNTGYNGRAKSFALGAQAAGTPVTVTLTDAVDATITTTRTVTLGV